MRIALYHNLPSGGAKRTLYEQAKRLSRKHRLELFSLSTADQVYADIRPFVKKTTILPFQPGRLFRTPFGRLNQAVRAFDLLRLRRVMRSLSERIHAQDFHLALVHPCMFTFSPTLLRYLQIPSLYYRHDPVRWSQDPPIPRPYDRANTFRQRLDRIDPLRSAYFRLLRREDETSTRCATRVVTNSYFMRESLFRIYGIAPSVSYHGVDIELFRPLEVARRDYVLSVGAISRTKGYDLIIQSLAHISPDLRPRLVLVANAVQAEERAYLTDLAKDLNVELEIHEMIDDHNLVKAYNQAICTVYTPVMEPFGLVPLESMACGTPVVGVREGGVRETIIDHQTGFLVDRDPKGLADSIQKFTRNPALIARMGQAAREHAEACWEWERAISRLEKYLMEVADDHIK